MTLELAWTYATSIPALPANPVSEHPSIVSEECEKGRGNHAKEEAKVSQRGSVDYAKEEGAVMLKSGK